MEGSSTKEPISCAGCLNNIGEDDYVSALDQEWHTDCFRCSVCDCLLSTWYHEKGGHLFCQQDYWARFGEPCHHCQQVMTGPVMAAGARRYHAECFACRGCGAPIDDREPYAVQNDRLYWYLASGNSFNSLHYEYLLGATTIREIVQETCEKIWLHLQAIYMPEPDENKWSDIANLFYKRSNFPNCLGAADGKHVRCEKPDMAGSQYYNYKHYHSIVLMAIADANYSFIAVDVGGYGSSSDSGIFKSTNFAKKLERNQMHIPHAKPLPNDDNGKEMPFVFVGDEAFALSEHIMRPYPRKNLSVTQRVFNYRLTRARRFVECTFGILTNKWRILHRALDVNITFCDVIIKACCVLHNYVRKHDGFCFSDELYGTELRSSRATPVRSCRNSMQNRDYFAQYFTSTRGSVPWQYEKI